MLKNARQSLQAYESPRKGTDRRSQEQRGEGQPNLWWPRVMSERNEMETRATAVQLPAVHIPLLLCSLS